eukprot:scaffold81550_cov48-Phaeocystis_antarctica.AAC.1
MLSCNRACSHILGLSRAQKTAEAREIRAAAAAANAKADADAKAAAEAEAEAEEVTQAAVMLQARVRGHAARSAVESPGEPLSPVAAPAASPNGPPRAPNMGSVQRRDTTSTLMGLMGST